MQQLCLQICNDVPPSITPGSHKPLADSQFAVVPFYGDKCEQLLLSVADNLLNCYSPDVSQACHSVHLCWQKICANLIT